jgi:hypothetical protein
MAARRKAAPPRKSTSRRTARTASGKKSTRKAPRKATTAGATTTAHRQPQGKTAKRSTAKASSTQGASAKRPAVKRWSQRVTRESDALDLRRGVFKLTSASKIAGSLKRSAEKSARRKAGAYRSALSMLTFYINRAGHNLSKPERARLERAKIELKRQFGRE